ncbi:MAG: carboxylating nicotinate-nucleotide diphosphorylase [Candidatus Ancillula sp.]|jgi:nicotinate-nucleotide pyrophosphorylase (carboxylating)|nr:carboxylating nicotinate-nucleotide diphosphorylase [Candidatus Ancillula sp.]
MNRLLLSQKLEEFLSEDIGTGDISTDYVFGEQEQSEGVFVAKEDGIVAGFEIGQEVYDLLATDKFGASFMPLKEDGDYVHKGEVIAKAQGQTKILLSGERIILNLMQRMSGIATATNQAIKILDDPTIQIVDTRKTAPGLRLFDKAAVRLGGGKNHRYALYDMVMLKDNHISFCGSITKAVQRVRKSINLATKIEVEVTSLEQLKESLDNQVDIVMFDNMDPWMIKDLMEVVKGYRDRGNKVLIEASGGINLANIANYKNSGVDYISLGFLTHSVHALDISFVENI